MFPRRQFYKINVSSLIFIALNHCQFFQNKALENGYQTVVLNLFLFQSPFLLFDMSSHFALGAFRNSFVNESKTKNVMCLILRVRWGVHHLDTHCSVLVNKLLRSAQYLGPFLRVCGWRHLKKAMLLLALE